MKERKENKNVNTEKKEEKKEELSTNNCSEITNNTPHYN